jgi:ketosteroid isomerase-like protein
MTSPNVGLIRSIYAAWERGDYSSVDWADPEIEYVIADGPSRGEWTGLAGIAAGWSTVLSAYRGSRVVLDEIRELDDERVFVLNHFSGRGKTSGVDVAHLQAKGATLFHLRDGKVTRLVGYFDRQRALAELDLDLGS